MKAVIDFETVDKHLETLGSGWVHGVDFKVIGGSLLKDGWDSPKWFTSKEEILNELKDVDTLIAHNAQYDLGILKMWGVDLSKYKLVDTLLLAKLYDSSLMSYSLDELSKRYLKTCKTKNEMAIAVLESGLIPARKPEDGEWTKLHITKGWNYSIKNMDVLYDINPQVVIDYCDYDVELTGKLHDLFMTKVNPAWVDKLSKLLLILLDSRSKGVKVSLKNVEKARQGFLRKELSIQNDIFSMVGYEFNLNSNKELPDVFMQLGIKFPFTPAGNPSIQKGWLEKQVHPVCQSIVLFRKYQKARRDFCDTLLESQKLLNPGQELQDTGRIYPEFIPFGAKTGRFSCRNPNIQQIPSRDPELGPLIRSCYLPEDGENWYSLDFSSQESRLQVHYAHMLNIPGSNSLVNQYKLDPNFDLHGLVAKLADITRTEAKTINLGLSYGMGLSKLAKGLNVTDQYAKEVKDKYNDAVPYLSILSRRCQDAMKKRGYIKTLGGRHVHMDAPIYVEDKRVTFEYKALNKLIQGSAADQTIEAMIRAYDEGIPFLFSVHDQLCASLKSRQQAERLKEIMETCVKLEVPMVVDLEEGTSWGDAEKDHGKTKAEAINHD